MLGLAGCSACAGLTTNSAEDPAPAAFYTVTGELALARHAPRVAAPRYASAAADASDRALLARATEVAIQTLQPSVAEQVAARWISVDPASLDAQRAAARAALALHKVGPSALHYRNVLAASPLGVESEFAAIDTDLGSSENPFGARQVADRLAAFYPASAAALRMQGFAALRADDPAAAVRSFTAYLARGDAPASSESGESSRVESSRDELLQALSRARILSGDVEGPLLAARTANEGHASPQRRLDYVLLLMTARQDDAASRELEALAKDPEAGPVAVRLLGLIELQHGRLDAATVRFAELLRTQKFLEDAFFYLALIAERQGDPERALRLYAQVQRGENTLPALLRATELLHKHGAAASAEELLDRLIEDEPLHAAEILSARARIYADGGDLPQALDVLLRARTEYPDSVELRYAVASTYEEQGNTAAALSELSALVRARPDDPAALNALGYTLADHSRQLAKARRLIDRAYAAAPRNPAILDSLGWVQFRQGHAHEAETSLRLAFADDRGGDIAAHLGEVVWRLGNPGEAERIWNEVSAVDADNRLLRETRQRLRTQAPPAVN